METAVLKAVETILSRPKVPSFFLTRIRSMTSPPLKDMVFARASPVTPRKLSLRNIERIISAAATDRVTVNGVR